MEKAQELKTTNSNLSKQEMIQELQEDNNSFSETDWEKEMQRTKVQELELNFIINRLLDDKKSVDHARREVLKFCLEHDFPSIQALKSLAKIKWQKDKQTMDTGKPSALKIAKMYLDRFHSADGLKLRFYNNQFYCFDGSFYDPLSEENLKAEVTRYIHQFSELENVAIKSLLDNILHHLKTLCYLALQTKGTFWLHSTPFTDENSYICLGNGLLNVDRFTKGYSNYFQNHSIDCFITHKLPFDFDEQAHCPVWLRFLNDTFGDDIGTVTLLQEWFGYNLIPDTSQHKFAIFHGEAGAGKSVCSTVLIELLGKTNVSSVSLEAFSSSKSFMLYSMVNVLANISAEISEFDRASEGLLKNFVSGEQITLDRKHRDPIQVKPTARLTYSTNVLPRIYDKSKGISRRLILIPFENSVEESKQNKNLSNPSFWIESGELTGIFNWALQGLKRLKERGYFYIPPQLEAAKNNYLAASNPILEFFELNFEFKAGALYSKSHAYQEYKNWCKDNGYNHLNAHHFSAELKKFFPKVSASKSALNLPPGPWGNIRDRVWEGLSKTGQ